MTTKKLWAALVLLGLTLAACASPAPRGEAAGTDGATFAQIGLADSSSENALWRDPGHAKAAVILLPGGNGVVHIGADGSVRSNNFLVRSFALWVEHGDAALLLDTPDGQSILGERNTPGYADAVGRAVAYVRARSAAPIWLVGTSQGTIAAANAAARLGTARIAGVVLTSSVTREGRSGETVFDTDLASIAVPALVLSDADDACIVSPPDDGPRIVAALKQAPRKVFLLTHGGGGWGNPCEALSPHGYDGDEAAIITRIADWMDAGQ